MSFCYQKISSPIGPLYLVASGEAICGITFENVWPSLKKKFPGVEEAESPILRKAQRQLNEYFAGKRKTFDLPLHFQGTPFQNRVWEALSKIPYGETRTYGQQAAIVKSPKAVRAVGRTNGLNPVCIVLPCHRVIGKDGSLTGFAGGLKMKKFLLNLEGIQ